MLMCDKCLKTIWCLLLSVCLIKSDGSQGKVFFQHPKQKPVMAQPGQSVNFTCELNITGFGIDCINDKQALDDSLEWHTPIYGDNPLLTGFNQGVFNVTALSAFDTQCQSLTSTLTFIARTEYNHLAFQCAVSEHPLASNISAKIWSRAAALKVNIEEVTPCPTAATSSQLPTPTTTPDLPTYEEIMQELEKAKSSIAELEIELEDTKTNLTVAIINEEQAVSRAEAAEDEVEEAESINYSVGAVLGAVTFLVLVVIIAFVVFAFKKTRKYKLNEPTYDFPPPMVDQPIEREP